MTYFFMFDWDSKDLDYLMEGTFVQPIAYGMEVRTLGFPLFVEGWQIAGFLK
jgi:hypothetical protein